mmetsp:Transcript_8027/g.12398  ORF Transcript_8027/g.12398 Transcript_8027/m.12398 type:complete len:159 (-) Transcript_8027:208-684(-)
MNARNFAAKRSRSQTAVPRRGSFVKENPDHAYGYKSVVVPHKSEPVARRRSSLPTNPDRLNTIPTLRSGSGGNPPNRRRNSIIACSPQYSSTTASNQYLTRGNRSSLGGEGTRQRRRHSLTSLDSPQSILRPPADRNARVQITKNTRRLRRKVVRFDL